MGKEKGDKPSGKPAGRKPLPPGVGAPLIEDARFAVAHKDPRFAREPSRAQRTVEIDERFAGESWLAARMMQGSARGRGRHGCMDWGVGACHASSVCWGEGCSTSCPAISAKVRVPTTFHRRHVQGCGLPGTHSCGQTRPQGGEGRPVQVALRLQSADAPAQEHLRHVWRTVGLQSAQQPASDALSSGRNNMLKPRRRYGMLGLCSP